MIKLKIQTILLLDDESLRKINYDKSYMVYNIEGIKQVREYIIFMYIYIHEMKFNFENIIPKTIHIFEEEKKIVNSFLHLF